MSIEGPAPLRSLQAGRAVAALAVVGFHTGQSLRAHYGGAPAWLDAALRNGLLGVDFFFVLSGFIIYWTNANRTGSPGWAADYALARSVRIYAPYLPVGLLVAALYVAAPDVSQGSRQWQWLPTATLLPWGQPALAVAWTLQYEILFYAIAGLMLWARKVLVGSLIWAALILLFRHPAGPLAPINLEFLFGIAAAWCVMHGRGPPQLVLLLLGSAATIGCALADDERLRLLFGFGIALLLVAVVRRERSGRLVVPEALVWLGAASYAIYLVHLPVQSLVDRLTPGLVLPWPAAMPLLAAAGIAAGCAYHLAWERPVLRLLDRFRRRGADPERS